MSNKCCLDFQSAVDQYLIRHRSALDVMTKYQESAARVNRAFAKAVTECGCIAVNAQRQRVPIDIEYSDTRRYMSSHLSGEPCRSCKEVLAKELGHSLFYLAALCDLSGLELNDVMDDELNNIKMLGHFGLT